MFGFGVPELIVILLIVIVVFGASKLPELGNALGQGIKNFKKGIGGEDVIEINVKKKDETTDKS